MKYDPLRECADIRGNTALAKMRDSPQARTSTSVESKEGVAVSCKLLSKSFDPLQNAKCESLRENAAIGLCRNACHGKDLLPDRRRATASAAAIREGRFDLCHGRQKQKVA